MNSVITSRSGNYYNEVFPLCILFFLKFHQFRVNNRDPSGGVRSGARTHRREFVSATEAKSPLRAYADVTVPNGILAIPVLDARSLRWLLLAL